MSWITLSPFHSHDEAAGHMVDLLAAEGEILNVPLTSEERELLAGNDTMSAELSSKTKYLIAHILKNESQEDFDPRAFSSSMEWASDAAWANVVELTYEVIDGLKPFPRRRGWARLKDKIALIGCGLLVVLLMFAAVTAAGLIFHWK
jgi:hypothetical protein